MLAALVACGPGATLTAEAQQAGTVADQSDGGTTPREQVATQVAESDISFLERQSRALADISDLVMPTVVHIQCQRPTPGGRNADGTGSGVIMFHEATQAYFVVTNHHVITGAELGTIKITLSSGEVIRPEKMMSDEKSDLAVLLVGEDNLNPASWGDSDKLRVGNLVLAVGSPFGLTQSVSLGIISARDRRSVKGSPTSSLINQDFLQTDAAINPGNSGGPLFDLRGNVIGINTAIATRSGGNDGIGFSIPSRLAEYVTNQLIENGKVRRAYLGVKLDPEFSSETAKRLKMERVRGVRVMEVYANTPAARHGLKIDDVILEFNNLVIEDRSQLVNLVSLSKIDSEATLKVYREGEEILITMVLSDRAELDPPVKNEPDNQEQDD